MPYPTPIVFSFELYQMTDIIETKNNTIEVTTEEGGVVSVEYTILNYKKECIIDGDNHNGKYRSVVVASTEDSESSRIVCYGIPKSIPIEDWRQMHGDRINTYDFLVNEIIEGTMMNLFHDERCNSWMLATKTAVGGNNYYFKQNYESNTFETEKSFKQMFIEALGGNPETDTLNTLKPIESLKKDLIYSFVMQHPSNQLVLDIIDPKVYLVAIYHVNEDNHVEYISQNAFDDWDGFDEIINFPKRYLINTTLGELIENDENDKYGNIGVMLTHVDTGDRIAIKNKNYEYVKQIRGNHPNLKYHYYELLKNGTLCEFLHYFPRYYTLFWKFYDEFMVFVQILHRKYVQFYVKKNNILIPKSYAILISRLHHEVYLPYKHVGVIIDRNSVIQFLLGLETKELYYYIWGFDKKNTKAICG